MLHNQITNIFKFSLPLFFMREFLLLALKAWTSPTFSLERLPDAGRMDLVCRTISNALWVSNDLRRDTIIHVALSGPKLPPKLISFSGALLKGVEPDERSLASSIKLALKAGISLQLHEERDVFPGITIAKEAFETFIQKKSNTHQLIYLRHKGKDIRICLFQENVLFVFGDFLGLPKKTEKLLSRFGAEKISLGPKTIFASHCPIIIHNELDRCR